MQHAVAGLTSAYVTGYVQPDTSGVFHKPLPSVCVSVFVARQRIFKDVAAARRTQFILCYCNFIEAGSLPSAVATVSPLTVGQQLLDVTYSLRSVPYR
jgi:hypothetical protein